ncbi:MAG: hypothetical protein WCO08_04775 [Actinomycetes bacterium]
MAFRAKLGRSNLSPQEEAEKIKAKFEKRREVQGLFTSAQEDLMAELGLTPGARDEIDHKGAETVSPAPKAKKKRQLFTKQQLKLMDELGLKPKHLETPDQTE